MNAGRATDGSWQGQGGKRLSGRRASLAIRSSRSIRYGGLILSRARKNKFEARNRNQIARNRSGRHPAPPPQTRRSIPRSRSRAEHSVRYPRLRIPPLRPPSSFPPANPGPGQQRTRRPSLCNPDRQSAPATPSRIVHSHQKALVQRSPGERRTRKEPSPPIAGAKGSGFSPRLPLRKIPH